IGDSAFESCPSLTAVHFQSNAPSFGASLFLNDNNTTVYYLPGTTGWGSSFAGRPTALWALPYPLILSHSLVFGLKTNGFGFHISWATNLSVVVEACTNLANPVWSPVSTNLLANGSSYYSDPEWPNYASRS